MALIIPEGFVQAVYEHSLTGDSEPMVTTMGHEFSDLSDPQATADFLHTAWATDMMPAAAPALTFTGVTIYVGHYPALPSVFVSSLANQAGTRVIDPAPPNVAHLVRKRTDLAGRRGRGRMYLPNGFVASDNLSPAGILTAGEITAVQTRVDDWLATLEGSNPGTILAYPTVLHRSEGEGVEPPPTRVLSLQLENKVATQRRRLRP